jgi:Ca-activated chloride channel family protein
MSKRFFARCRPALLAALVLFFVGSQARAAGLLIADGGLGGALQIKSHDVHVTINNGIAVTTVDQVFLNKEDRQVEALYTFPVPRGASVANFSMWINGKEMVGEVVEKKRAREIYDSYKAKRRDPGLLEQTDYRTFEMRIFPIAPRAEQHVQVTYYQELNFDHDWATYVYPLASSTRPGVDSRAQGKFAINVDVKSEIPIVAMESPSHAKDFAVAKQTDSYFQASLETREGSLNKDVVLNYHVSRPHTGIDVIASKEKGQDGYFALTLTAGEELPQKEAQMDYVFVLDISGSMADDGKLDLSRKSLGAFIKSLGAKDRFEVMTFNVQPTTAFGKLREADDAAKKEAENFLATQIAKGGTILNPAMTTAYKYAADRPLNVIILSDGMTEQTERQQLADLIRQRPKDSRVFCIGVGNDVNRGLLEQLADDSGGLAAFISRDDNFEQQASAFRRKLMRPVATNLKIEFAGADVYDIEPQQLPNLYYGAPVRVYGRYKNGGDVKVNLAATVLDHPIKDSLAVELPKEEGGNPEIERMWAWHKVDRLLKQADASGSRTSVIDEIVRLGEGYSIATEYTSFIVLENDLEFQRWHIDRKNVTRLSRDRKAQEAVTARLDALRNKANDQLGPEALTASAKPLANDVTIAPNVSTPVRDVTPAPSNNSPRSRDISLPSVGGGGAMDPATVGAILSLGAIAVVALRKTRAKA